MRNWMETKVPRRLLSLALSAAMVLSLLPVFAFAEETDGLCQHHPAHTPECGYVEAVEGQDCTHVCGDACYTVTTDCKHNHDESCYSDGVLPNQGEEKTADACTHVCSEESGCVTKTHACVHTAHDETCGYVEAVAGQPCSFVCKECGCTGWVEEDGNWYYLTEGVMQTGWQNGIPGYEGKWFYFDPETGAMQTGWQNGIPGYEGKWLYFDPETGVMQTGWQNGIPGYEGKWLYFDPETGVMQTGWQNGLPGYEGKWFYFDPATGAMQTGWQSGLPGYEGKWFYFDPATGAMQTDLQSGIPDYVDAWYYLDPETGAIQTGGVQGQSQSGTFNGSPAEVDADGSLLINDTNFPDATFRGIVSGYDEDGSGSLSEEEVAAVTGIDCSNYGIGSLKGIEYFTALTELNCGFNQLKELDVSENKALTELNCYGNQLKELDVSENKALTALNCGSNQLTELDVSENKALTLLDCYSNQLKELDVSENKALTALNCGYNQLTELDVSENKALTELACSSNQLTELDVSENKALTSLYCGSNQLTELDVSNHTALTELYCHGNQLTSLNVSGNTALTRLACQNNKLAALDLTGLSIAYRDLGGQTPYAVLRLRDGKLTVDLGRLVGTENLSRVQSLNGGTMDSDGIVTIPIPSDPTADIQVSYRYDTQSGYSDLLPVTLTHKHSFDENGDCACGLVKKVPYVDAQGNSLGTQVCTILTGDATTLTAGWYVASGSVTIGTEEAPNRVTVSGDVNLILEDGCDLIVNGGIQVQDNSTDSTPNTNALTIYAQSTAETTMGKLTAQNVDSDNAAIGGSDGGGSGGEITINGGIVKAESNWGAAIGGGGIGDGIGGSGGEITINGGIVKAESSWGAAIGGGSASGGYGGSGGEITINGGVVRASSSDGAGIGGGGGACGGSGGEITINGGVVRASSSDGAGIGGGNGASFSNGASGTFSTGTNGNAVIFASSISDKSSQSSWSGVIFEDAAGKVYGSPTLSLGLPIPKDKSLTLDMDGNSLTFAGSTGITLNSGSTLTLSGPGTFPGGISVSGGTLGGLLAEGWAFTQNGKCIPVDGVTSLSDAISLSRITVTITGQPADVSVTYGDTASLSVTAVPVTSGSTVSYQWYLNGSALPEETGSTLSLSGLDVGSYQVSCAVTCDGFTVNSVTAAVTVGKAAGSITITGDPGKTYDGLPAMLNQDMYTTTGGAVKVEYKVKGADDSTYTMSVPKNAGDYTVRVTAEDANHTPASATKDFTITPKEVTLTVTIKDKRFDNSVTAEIDTVKTNDFVSGDDVRVVNGTPTFARSTLGEQIPVSFTEFTLTGDDAGNYRLAQPTGVTGRILASASYLDLTNNPDFADHTEVWVDGVSYPIQAEDGPYVSLPEEGGLLTIYTYQQGSAHEQYPTGMAVYRIDRQDTGATLEKIDAFDDLLQYSGCSIRVTGKRGIRMITSLTQGSKKALTGSGLAGYTLEEYGTVVQWADTLGSNSLTLATGKHNYAYKKGVADPVFATTDTLTQYTNVLVWESLTDAQLGQDIVMRPYIILRDGNGNTVTLYGGCVSRSIGYIAYQNRAVFNPGTAAYKYVWDIIHAVYGNQYNSEYKG